MDAGLVEAERHGAARLAQIVARRAHGALHRRRLGRLRGRTEGSFRRGQRPRPGRAAPERAPLTPLPPPPPRRAGAVAQFSSRPASLLQQWDKAGDYKWCLEGMGCCDQKGVCNQQARLVTLQAAERLARMPQLMALIRQLGRAERSVDAPPYASALPNT